MKGKIDIIYYCGDCSNRYYDGNDLKCDKKLDDNTVSENKHPPDWCPLPNAPEEDNPKKKWCVKPN